MILQCHLIDQHPSKNFIKLLAQINDLNRRLKYKEFKSSIKIYFDQFRIHFFLSTFLLRSIYIGRNRILYAVICKNWLIIILLTVKYSSLTVEWERNTRLWFVNSYRLRYIVTTSTKMFPKSWYFVYNM